MQQLKAINGKGFDHTIVTAEGEFELIATVNNWNDESFKFAQLFAAAPQMHEAVCAASDFLHKAFPTDVEHSQEVNTLLWQLRDAEAAVKGAIARGKK